MAEESFEVVVIGAGPHALSLLCRLVDDQPDLLHEAERSYIMAKAGSRARSHTEVRKHLKKRFNASTALRGKVIVLDPNGSWIAQWGRNFGALQIEHLRSHADLHCDPYDFQALRVWAEMHKRTSELWHMQYLDREGARAAGFAGPFALPGSKLFEDFTRMQVARYKADTLLRKAVVSRVEVVPPAVDGGACSFVLRLADGTSMRARRVVSALGPGALFAGLRETAPWWSEQAAQRLRETPPSRADPSRLAHSSALIRWLATEGEAARATLRGKRVLVVGGGQTAGHLSLLALKASCASLTLVARRTIKQKPFDIDLELVGDRRGEVLERFHALETNQQRVEFIAAIRGGGSMSHEVFHEVLSHCEGGSAALDPPRATVVEEVEVSTAKWSPDETEADGSFEVKFDDGSGGRFDSIWMATGGELDCTLVPLYADLLAQRPIAVVQGLPALQPDLSWDANCPLYVMGAFAQLQLGADALNLAGCRAGSVLVARALREELLSADLASATAVAADAQ